MTKRGLESIFEHPMESPSPHNNCFLSGAGVSSIPQFSGIPWTGFFCIAGTNHEFKPPVRLDLETAIQSEVSQTEKNKHSTIITYMWNLEKW